MVQKVIDFQALPQAIVPVVTIPDQESVEPMVDALVNGGCQILEITLRTPAGLSAIEYTSKKYPQVLVGAGSIVGVNEWSLAVDAGSQFLVSPGATDELYNFSKIKPCPWLPGVASASDLMKAHEKGIECVKFFPASVLGGIKAIKAYSSVFTEMKFCPTGGVATEEAVQWLQEPMIFAVGGSWFTPKDLIQSQNWSGLEQHVGKLIDFFAQQKKDKA